MSYYEFIGPELLKRELGVHNWVDDRGGKTAHGITERLAGKLGYDIDSITRDDAMEIYKDEYYDSQRLDEMPSISVAWRMAVDGLHSGSGSVMRRLQMLCNLHQQNDQVLTLDGRCGDNTLAQVEHVLGAIHHEYHKRGDLYRSMASNLAEADLCGQLKGLQYGHYYRIVTRDPSQMKWWKGWLNRIRFEPEWYLAT